MQSSTKIYVAFHRPAPFVSGGSIQPIQVGRALARDGIPGMIGDETGDTISDRNSSYCELTALYWAWKNTDAAVDRIGLMHYRRFLDFTDRQPGTLVEQSPRALHLPDWHAEIEAWVSGPGQAFDLVLPRKHQMGMTVGDNYATRHRTAEFDLATEILRRDHPEMVATLDRVTQGRQLRLGNLMVMRRDLLDRYCSWLFPILDEVEARAPKVPTSPYQSRSIGFLAERLLTIYTDHLIASEPVLKVHEVSILNLARTLITPYMDDESLNGPEHVNIALACDRNYLPHAAAMLRSVLVRASKDRQINLFMLHESIGDRGREMLREVVAESHPRAVLHEIDTGDAFQDAHRSTTRAPSNTTYARFLLFSLLPRIRRILYLDCDVIALRDVTALYDADLDGAAIGGVPDWIMTRSLTGPVPTREPEVPDLGDYQRKVLGLNAEDQATYLNAGVMVFDFSQIDDVAATGAKLTEMAETGRYFFRDQDILNSYFKDRKAVLDARWNVFNSSSAAYMKVPLEGHRQAMAAKRDPWIIHYADAAWKPWQPAAVPLSQHYWQALIATPFYGEVLRSLMPKNETKTLYRRAMQALAARGVGLIEAVPILRKPLLRLHALLGHPGRR